MQGIFTGRIVGGFEKEGISVLPLKGILMKKVLSGYKYADDGGSGYFV